MRLTPEQEASYALDYGVSRADLAPHIQTEYDRLLAERRVAATRPPDSAAANPVPATWQGFVPPPRRQPWPGLLLGAAGFAFVAAFIVGGYGGSNGADAANLAAAVLFLFAVAGACVAVPVMLYRRYRVTWMVARVAQPANPFAPCYRCGFPLAVHAGDDLKCPEGGMCHRCGQPFSGHLGYELTCPAPHSPRAAER